MEKKNLIAATGAVLIIAVAGLGLHIKNKRDRDKKRQMILDWQRLRIIDDEVYRISNRPNPAGFRSQDNDESNRIVFRKYEDIKERVNKYIVKDTFLWEKANPQWKEELNNLTLDCQYQITTS